MEFKPIKNSKPFVGGDTVTITLTKSEAGMIIATGLVIQQLLAHVDPTPDALCYIRMNDDVALSLAEKVGKSLGCV